MKLNYVILNLFQGLYYKMLKQVQHDDKIIYFK